MKVLNLQCAHGHGFEGWFASEDDFQSQTTRGLVSCPMCEDSHITRLPSAPRLNLSGSREPRRPDAAHTAAAAAQAPQADPSSHAALSTPAALQALWLETLAKVVQSTEDVGERFPEEARRMHYGETETRGIRGQASPQERAALAEEGIEVMPLPLPEHLKGSAH
jgi:hypothetical protein